MEKNAQCATHPVPEVISDQLLIWENERTRIRPEKAVCYSDFAREEDFVTLQDAAKGMRAILHVDYEQQVIVVKDFARERLDKTLEEMKKSRN